MSSGENGSTSELVLQHLARYRLSFQEIISRVYLDGRSPQALLNRLKGDDLVSVLAGPGFPRNRRAYVLTEKATTKLGLPRSRANPLTGQSFNEQFARLSYCYFSGWPCAAVDRAEALPMYEAFGKITNVFLVLRQALAGGGHVLELLSFVGATARPRDVLDRVRKLRDCIDSSARLRELAGRRLLTIVLVTQNVNRQDYLNTTMLSDLGDADGRCAVRAAAVPWLDDLEEALKRVVET